MNFTKTMKEKVLSGEKITKEEALTLYEQEFQELTTSANQIRQHFCGNRFDLCTIINGKSGRCSEDCKYCSQSAHFNTKCEEYPLLPLEEVVTHAKKKEVQGVQRYSIVTSGRDLSDPEIQEVCHIVTELSKKTGLKICGSFGLLQGYQYKKLYDAGLQRIHNNLETSQNYFPEMCSTHSQGDKISSLEQARKEGMYLCSGGIFGIGESLEDRISLAFQLEELQIKSVPMNLLSPISGTPYEKNVPLTPEEFSRIVAVYRFILPRGFLRLAGGRGLLPDKGKQAFLSGANATITGDMLTTSGYTVESDLKMIAALGFQVDL